MLWSTLSLVMVLAYNSNLRASLISVEIEPNLDTMEMVLQETNKMYIMQNAVRLK